MAAPPSTNMSQYLVHFDWDDDVESHDDARRELNADTIVAAKLEAAMMYAGQAFESAPPTAYRILQNGKTEVYRYPEEREPLLIGGA